MSAIRTILLAEDSPADAEMAIDALRDANLANPIVHVEDGVEAPDVLLAFDLQRPRLGPDVDREPARARRLPADRAVAEVERIGMRRLDGEAHRVFIAQAAAGVEGVFNVGLHRVGVIQHGGNPALGPERRTVSQVALAQDGYAQMARQSQSKAQACGAATNHQDIVLKLLAHLWDSAKSDP